ncbi:hypothetical protein L4D21_10125 [Photobacterium profundum]|uniref:hypothetical protein n=1 Tax=Photobacterium profundum TaxID=74109 RepID=UPI003D0ECF02
MKKYLLAISFLSLSLPVAAVDVICDDIIAVSKDGSVNDSLILVSRAIGHMDFNDSIDYGNMFAALSEADQSKFVSDSIILCDSLPGNAPLSNILKKFIK